MAQPLRKRVRRVLVGAAAALVPACASHEPPSADQSPAAPPDLAGRTVILLPVQRTRGAHVDGLDAELAFWLGERGTDVEWVLPAAIDAALARSPGLGIEPRSLDVSTFLAAEVRRVGDPLFGDLRRLSAILDARFALLPVAGGYVGEGDAGRTEIVAALIDAHGGAVLWFGVVAGEAGPASSPAVAASAAQAFARTLFP